MVGSPMVAPRTPVPVTSSKDAEAMAVPWGKLLLSALADRPEM